MTREPADSDFDAEAEGGHAYSVFMLVLTVISLAVMVLLVLPLPAETTTLLIFYDNAICVIFIVDFAMRMVRAKSKRDYFFRQRGWLDLLGSVPSLQFFRFTVLLRLARLSRLARIARVLEARNRDELARDVIANRTQYAGFVTVLLAFVVLITASVLVLNAETRSDDANIDSGWDAFWWAFVTITTVGYGDRYPVTTAGRVGAMLVMTMGIGIIGALASILASVLVGDGDEPEPAPAADVSAELEAMRNELAALREAVDRLPRGEPPSV
jgi:voltage-gated potassium channel